MPSTKQQFNLVLDDITRSIIWEIAGEREELPINVIRSLLATHPDVQHKAQARGVVPQPESVGWGGRRKAKSE